MIIVTGDWHCNYGIYTNICLNFMDDLIAFSKKNKVEKIFFTGDILEKSSRVRNETFVPLFMKFKEFPNTIEKYFILGNHDIYSVDNSSLLETFSGFGEVVKYNKSISIDGVTYVFQSYTKDLSTLPKGDVLITHLPICNFSFDNSYMSPDKESFQEELFEDYKLVVSGHFHNHQSKGNIVYHGSPYQLNFGEMGNKNGFVVVNGTDWDFVEYKKSPKYKKIKIENYNNEDMKNTFVGIEIDNKFENIAKLKHILMEKGALDVKPFFTSKTNDFNVEKNNETFTVDKNVYLLLNEYINTISFQKDINKDTLFNILTGVVSNESI